MLSIENGREFVTHFLERGRIIEPSHKLKSVEFASMQFRYELCMVRCTDTNYETKLQLAKGGIPPLIPLSNRSL